MAVNTTIIVVVVGMYDRQVDARIDGSLYPIHEVDAGARTNHGFVRDVVKGTGSKTGHAGRLRRLEHMLDIATMLVKAGPAARDALVEHI